MPNMSCRHEEEENFSLRRLRLRWEVVGFCHVHFPPHIAPQRMRIQEKKVQTFKQTSLRGENSPRLSVSLPGT